MSHKTLLDLMAVPAATGWSEYAEFGPGGHVYDMLGTYPPMMKPEFPQAEQSLLQRALPEGGLPPPLRLELFICNTQPAEQP